MKPNSPDKINDIVFALSQRKEPSPNSIINEMLKNLPPLAINRLSSFATSAMSLGSFPTRWKAATVLMLRLLGLQRWPKPWRRFYYTCQKSL
ncbi:hypothetical protein Zmor_004266 [Zophobas morio]|uniref:Uncharacterized protein n=1 Tax=Zophobas morio TaxID=2755281 RepID=A0AA38HI62_9CUCU|nr:hypothetical protein Zmor_004266 [Zophobas morio]